MRWRLAAAGGGKTALIRALVRVQVQVLVQVRVQVLAQVRPARQERLSPERVRVQPAVRRALRGVPAGARAARQQWRLPRWR